MELSEFLELTKTIKQKSGKEKKINCSRFQLNLVVILLKQKMQSLQWSHPLFKIKLDSWLKIISSNQ